jgi:hypothetical protein
MDNKNLRTIQKKVNGKWVNVNYNEIEPGDVFRMFDPDGTPVVDDNRYGGKTEFTAASKAHPVSITGEETFIIDIEGGF